MTTLDLILKEERKTNDGRGFIFKTREGLPIFTVDKKFRDEIEKKNKWKICLSLSSGCLVGCIYCFTKKYGFYRPLRAKEIVEQVEYILNLPENSGKEKLKEYDEIKVEMKEMGDPLLNPKNTLDALVKLYKRHPDFLYVVSTAGPNRNLFFLEKLRQLRDSGMKIRLQFSCHTTNEQERAVLSPEINMLSLKDISNIAKKWYNKKSKVTLNFLLLKNYEADANKLAEIFNKDEVFIKVSYLDENHNTKGKLFQKSGEEMNKFISGLKEKGFECAYRNGYH